MGKAVILAAGLGTRMRKRAPDVALSAGQESVAATGIKALIPIPRSDSGDARPFLDYVLSSLADAGYRRVCLVIGPRHDELRRYYENRSGGRLEIDFAVQHKPLGTANALLAAEKFVGNGRFLVINSDNYYPTSALKCLRTLEDGGLVGFDRQALILGSNIPAQRIASFAAVEVDAEGNLASIVEKSEAGSDAALVSMNCWRFGPTIFSACRAIGPSSRGEYEIPSAVMHSIGHLDQTFRVLTSSEPVFDMSRRSDIESVAHFLRAVEVRL